MDSKSVGKIRRILKKHKIKKAALFGSAARGEEKRGSDIDILIEPPRAFTLFGLARLKAELESALKKSVDLVTFRSVDTLLKPHIMKDLRMII